MIQFPYFYQIVPKEQTQYLGIVKLLLHFQWTWVGLFIPDNDKGEQFVSTLRPEIIRNGICIAFTHRLLPVLLDAFQSYQKRRDRFVSFLMQDQVNVLIALGDYFSITCIERFVSTIGNDSKLKMGKVWIITSLLVTSLRFSIYGEPIGHVHTLLSFSIQTNKMMTSVNFKAFYGAVKKFGRGAFDCINSVSPTILANCREKDELESLPQDSTDRILSQDSYNIYNAVQVVAHALNAAYSSRSRHMLMVDEEGLNRQHIQPWQVFFIFVTFSREIQ